MADPQWKPAMNNREKKRRAQREKARWWAALLKDYPHIVSPYQAKLIAEKLRVSLLAEKLLSPEWIEHQKAGWVYLKTLKMQPENLPTIPENDESTEYSVFDIGNEWGDKVLFSKKLHKHV